MRARFSFRLRAGTVGCSVALALPIVLAPSAPLIHAASGADSTDVSWLPGGYVDYAPIGMPDFSQCRPEWSQPGSPGQWTYAGPVALADALWWLDSAAEPAPRPPSEPHDGHGLVTAYPVFGPVVDDHSSTTLFALVEDLALRAGTDGHGGQTAVRGTRWETLVAATEDYVADRRLTARYRVTHRTVPDSAWLAARLAEGAGTVLQLGVWEWQAESWRRVGGHYATLAGGSTDGRSIALADPLADSAGLGGAGRSEPADAQAHSCREAPRAHDDAAVVSHDLRRLVSQPALPDERLVVENYLGPDNQHEAAAFQDQNPSTALVRLGATWQRGLVVMALDGGLAISPVGSLPTASPTSTVPPVSPTMTAIAATDVPDTATPDAPPTLDTPEPSATATLAPLRTRTPSPRPSADFRLCLPIVLRTEP